MPCSFRHYRKCTLNEWNHSKVITSLRSQNSVFSRSAKIAQKCYASLGWSHRRTRIPERAYILCFTSVKHCKTERVSGIAVPLSLFSGPQRGAHFLAGGWSEWGPKIASKCNPSLELGVGKWSKKIYAVENDILTPFAPGFWKSLEPASRP